MGLLDRGQAMVNRTHKAGGGSVVDITYTRKVAGATQTTPTPTIKARHGRSLAYSRTEGDIGPALQAGERVYLIEVADLELNGVSSTPLRGDRITEAGVAWDVAAPDTGEPPWRYSDQTRTLYRIFARRAA